MKLHLNDGWLESQPKWWKNYIYYLNNNIPPAFEDGRTDAICAELAKEGAKLVHNTSAPSFLEFDNAAEATLFLIKWS